MALSNWDTLAFGPDGKSMAGSYTSPSKIGVDIYKNWLYVRDPKGWNKGLPFAKPTIMSVEQGNLTYGDLNIVAARHDDQDAVFCLVSRYYRKGKERFVDYFGGIGCYAYLTLSEWYMLHNPQHLKDILAEQGGEWLWGLLEKGQVESHEMWSSHLFGEESGAVKSGCSIIVPGRTQSGRKRKQGILGSAEFVIHVDDEGDEPDTFEGVKDSTYEAWLKWAKSIGGEDEEFMQWIGKIKSSTPLRYNQGDAFFMGFEDVSTPVGSQQSTILSSVN